MATCPADLSTGGARRTQVWIAPVAARARNSRPASNSMPSTTLKGMPAARNEATIDAGTMPGPTANGSRVTRANKAVPAAQARAVAATAPACAFALPPASIIGISTTM